MHFNSALANIKPYASKAISESVQSRSDMISLSIGEPDFGPPTNFLFTDISSPVQDLKKYEVARGSVALREAVSKYLVDQFNTQVLPFENILMTHGAVAAITLAIIVCSEPGDEIIVFDPSYMLYERSVLLNGRTPRPVTRAAGGGFDMDAVRSAITPRTRAVIINSPENPTGYVAPEDEIFALHSLCEKYGLWLIHDEVYDQFTFDSQHVSALALCGMDRVVSINSFSKKFGVPGLRLGWLCANKMFVDAASIVSDYLFLGINGGIARTGIALLQTPKLSDWFSAVRQGLQSRMLCLGQALESTGAFEFPWKPKGGMFLFPKIYNNVAPSGVEMARRLREDAGVSVVPGGVYGASTSKHIRLIVCQPNAVIQDAATRILNAFKT